MNKIINDLLDTNARVIIPEFGAFIIKQKSPRLIVFNEFLRYNDGLLIDYVSVSEEITKDAAKEKVTKFVEELNNKLTTGEEIIFAGLGKLVKESSGKLTLLEQTASELTQKKTEKKIQSEKESKPIVDVLKKESKAEIKEEQKKDIQQEAVKPEPLQKEVKEEDVKPTPLKEEKKEAVKPEPLQKEVKEKDVKPSPPLKEEKQEKVKPEPIQTEEKTDIEITLEKEEKKPSQPEKKIQAKEERITVAPIKTHEEKVTPKKPQPLEKPIIKTEHKNKTKKNSRQFIIWILLIIIVNGAIVAWFVFNDKITGIFKKDKQPTTEISSPAEITNESIVEENTDELVNPVLEPEETSTQNTKKPVKVTNTPSTVQPAIRNNKQYYIVAGCFRDEKNADNLVVELQKNGYKAEKFGKIGNLHAVSYESFTDKPTALQELKNVRNAGYPEAWVIFY